MKSTLRADKEGSYSRRRVIGWDISALKRMFDRRGSGVVLNVVFQVLILAVIGVPD